MMTKIPTSTIVLVIKVKTILSMNIKDENFIKFLPLVEASKQFFSHTTSVYL